MVICRTTLVVFALAATGCRCQRLPGQIHEMDAEQSQQTTRATDLTHASLQSAPVSPTELDRWQQGAVNTVDRYLHLLVQGQHDAALALWARPPAVSPDADLIQRLSGASSVRMTTFAGKRSGNDDASLAVEVPISLRIATSDGLIQYAGWYRLEPLTDGRWMIDAAQLQRLPQSP